MNNTIYDIIVVGAGPVGLMCSYLAELCGLKVLALDKSEAPLKVGRADALNARTLQLMQLAGLFDELYPLGKICNTSSIWENGKFTARQSSWWEDLEGCLHKHFLMLGQSHVEALLDRKLKEKSNPVLRNTSIKDIEVNDDICLTTLSNGEQFKSKFVIGADGSQSFVRRKFNIGFDIVRPEITWAVVDGIIDSDFPKVPEIIVFQGETADVAWIPREGDLDRFYIRMDKKEFSFEEVMDKINKAVKPHSLNFKEVVWFSQFSVKESVAEKFSVDNKVFLAGDSCHVHSVNGGQGLNTGLADAFNLIWKLNAKIKDIAPMNILNSYENERKPVAQSVIDSSGELVRSTKFSEKGTNAQDYLRIVEKRSGNITGMGIHYGEEKGVGSRLFDIELSKSGKTMSLYSLLDYSKHTLIIFGDSGEVVKPSVNTNVIRIDSKYSSSNYWTNSNEYRDKAILVRPDSYIEAIAPLRDVAKLQQGQ